MPRPSVGSFAKLPSNWVIAWERFAGAPNAEAPDRSARKIDSCLAPPLAQLSNEPDLPREISQHLARRNLRRGHRLNIPSGHVVALFLGVVLAPVVVVGGVGLRLYRDVTGKRPAFTNWIADRIENITGSRKEEPSPVDPLAIGDLREFRVEFVGMPEGARLVPVGDGFAVLLVARIRPIVPELPLIMSGAGSAFDATQMANTCQP